MSTGEGYRKIAAARLKAAHVRPYLAAALFSLQFVEKPGLQKITLGPIATDEHWRCYYDPDTISGWPIDETFGVLIHEVAHLLRGHADRCKAGGFHPIGFNIAGDLEINDDLLAEDIKLPQGALEPKNLNLQDDQMAEWYYHQLEKEAEKRAAGNGDDGGEGQGKPGDDKQPGSGNCGSCADGQGKEYEDAVVEGQCMDKVEEELVKRKVAQDIKEHKKSTGKIPAHWDRWADEKIKRKVDWRRVLAASVRNSIARTTGMVDYSYCRPSRRQSAFKGVIIPTMVKPEPYIAIVVDTSGSMGQSELDQAMAEIDSVLKTVGASQGVQVLTVDAEVHGNRRVVSSRQVVLKGGGGTDMGVGLYAAKSLRPRPQIVIVLTDGYTPWPSKKPFPARVIVALTGRGGSCPDWARRIDMEDAA